MKNKQKKEKNEQPKKKLVQKNKEWMPGQKYDTPDEGDGTRIFYETLLMQKPDCIMAMKYCVENGLL